MKMIDCTTLVPIWLSRLITIMSFLWLIFLFLAIIFFIYNLVTKRKLLDLKMILVLLLFAVSILTYLGLYFYISQYIYSHTGLNANEYLDKCL